MFTNQCLIWFCWFIEKIREDLNRTLASKWGKISPASMLIVAINPLLSVRCFLKHRPVRHTSLPPGWPPPPHFQRGFLHVYLPTYIETHTCKVFGGCPHFPPWQYVPILHFKADIIDNIPRYGLFMGFDTETLKKKWKSWKLETILGNQRGWVERVGEHTENSRCSRIITQCLFSLFQLFYS